MGVRVYVFFILLRLLCHSAPASSPFTGEDVRRTGRGYLPPPRGRMFAGQVGVLSSPSTGEDVRRTGRGLEYRKIHTPITSMLHEAGML